MYETDEFPSVVQIADLDSDGNSDMVLVMSSDKANAKKSAKIYTFKNVECSPEALEQIFTGDQTDLNQEINCRYFNHTSFDDKFDFIENENIVRLGFFDFDELGSLGILGQKYNSDSDQNSIRSYFNFLRAESELFVKIGTNTDGINNGNTFIGASHLTIKIDNNGYKIPMSGNFFGIKIQAGQQYSLSHNRLQLPFT